MIIDNIKKLVKFLSNKPVKYLNNCLDCTKEFALRQITYSYLVTLSLVFLSTISIILPRSSSNSQILSSSVTHSPVKAEAVSSKRQIGLSILKAFFQLASGGSSKAVQVAKYLAPTPEKIKKYVPLTFVASYSLSSANSMRFFVVLKPINTHLQVPLSEYAPNEDEYLSVGVYMEGVNLMAPSFPYIKNRLIDAKDILKSHLGLAIRKINQFFDDSIDVFYEEVLDPSTSHTESAPPHSNSLETMDREEVDNALRSDSVGLVRTSSRYPNQNTGEVPTVQRTFRSNARINRSRFTAFKSHVLNSVYIRFDLLKTFVLRIEP